MDRDDANEAEKGKAYADVYEWIENDPFGFAEAFAEDIARRNGLKYRKRDDEKGTAR